VVYRDRAEGVNPRSPPSGANRSFYSQFKAARGAADRSRYFGFVEADGPAKVRDALDSVIPAGQFPFTEPDIPGLSRLYRFVERGISLGPFVINQSNHIFSRSPGTERSDVASGFSETRGVENANKWES
jgi:hypothetical protein